MNTCAFVVAFACPTPSDKTALGSRCAECLRSTAFRCRTFSTQVYTCNQHARDKPKQMAFPRDERRCRQSGEQDSPVKYHRQDCDRYRSQASDIPSSTDKIAKDDLRIREWMTPRFEMYAKRGWPPSVLRRIKAHHWACLGTARTWLGDVKGGRRAYVESLKLMPWRFKSVLRLMATLLPRRAYRALK